MFGFIKKIFFAAVTFFNLSCVNSLDCVLLKNQGCEIRPEIINANNNDNQRSIHAVLK